MTDYEKLRTARQALEELREELACELRDQDGASPVCQDLHHRVSKALAALQPAA